MPAGIVRAYISAQIAGTLLSGRRFAGYIQATMNGLLIHLYSHAPAAVSPEWFEIISFSAGTDGHSIRLADFNKGLAQSKPVFRRDFSCFRKVVSGLFI